MRSKPHYALIALALARRARNAGLARHLEQLQAPLAQVEQVAHVAPGVRLDAREHLLDAAVVPIGGHEQAAEGVVGARVVVPVQMRGEAPPHLADIAVGAWAAREKVNVIAWHLDHGLSGGSELDVRPALGAALGELRVRGAGVLVVARRARLARDSAIAIERAARACGARVASADGVANDGSPADDFLRRILDAAAEYERALIRARTKAALTAKRARRERAGEVPFGCVRLGMVSRAGRPLQKTQIERLVRSAQV